MATITFSDDYNRTLVNEIVKQLVPVLIQELRQEELPPLLTRKEFMELVGIGDTKCNELFHREDFPVTRAMGNPKVITKEFFSWISKMPNEPNEVNLKHPYKVI